MTAPRNAAMAGSGLDRCTCGEATGGMAGAVAQRRQRGKHSRSDEATPTYVLWPNGSSKGTGGQVFLVPDRLTGKSNTASRAPYASHSRNGFHEAFQPLFILFRKAVHRRT